MGSTINLIAFKFRSSGKSSFSYLDAVLVWLAGQVSGEDIPDVLFALDVLAPHLKSVGSNEKQSTKKIECSKTSTKVLLNYKMTKF